MIKNRSIIALASALTLTAGCALSQTETDTGAPLARQIGQSSHCGLAAPGHLILRSVDDVDRLEQLPARTLSLAPLRELDYGREYVVLAALGQKPTGGFSVMLADSAIVDGRLDLTVNIKAPEPGAVVPQMMTTPCAVIAVTAAGWEGLRLVPAENNR
ncbi:protease complex subunit PrcB family protein [Marinobacter salinisoli]|uniref:Protease complex subunit PrcB family protein n=1 Tax=Marinobacter salinisoli TaxID=2769486 RepID=A0ABX7MU22_9GAMM|nr:protease complex subunit PrcB family protein [Marinobacter salinisoli]QSP94601.1 protease complex subunit PrcB family protein [Marinobacter salinisoli]